jgi:hypothetical protein
MPQLTQMSVSTQLVQQEIEATLLGQPHDPTGDVVTMAFMPYPSSNYGTPPNPGPGDWHAASWETDTAGLLPTYWAVCLVGPANGGLVLAAGRYRIAVKVTDNPEVPALWGWDLAIT